MEVREHAVTIQIILMDYLDGCFFLPTGKYYIKDIYINKKMLFMTRKTSF